MVALSPLGGCSRKPPPHAECAATTAPSRLETPTPGLENVWQLSDKLYCGGSPAGDAGFRTLALLGVKSIVSVDGARPNVIMAQRYGLQYLHAPVTYDGISRDKVLYLAKALQELPGPIYLHCHHGKHRGPAAAVAAMMCIRPELMPEQAVELMQQIGTDPHYRGLYSVPTSLVRPTSEELKAVQLILSHTSEVTPLAESMVRIDLHWDRLASWKEAGWKQPAGHPAMVPHHEALLLFEQLYELGRVYSHHPSDFLQMAREARDAVSELEHVLSERSTNANTELLDERFQRVEQSCNKCHELYRDNPSHTK